MQCPVIARGLHSLTQQVTSHFVFCDPVAALQIRNLILARHLLPICKTAAQSHKTGDHFMQMVKKSYCVIGFFRCVCCAGEVGI